MQRITKIEYLQDENNKGTDLYKKCAKYLGTVDQEELKDLHIKQTEKIKAYRKKYYSENREKLLKYREEYWEKNQEDIKEKYADYRKDYYAKRTVKYKLKNNK